MSNEYWSNSLMVMHIENREELLILPEIWTCQIMLEIVTLKSPTHFRSLCPPISPIPMEYLTFIFLCTNFTIQNRVIILFFL